MSFEIYLLAEILLMLAGGAAMLFLLLSSLSFLYGAPFVSTDAGTVRAALRLSRLKKGERFYDLGSGDGRAVFAASEIGAKAVGVEINPVLWLWSACASILRKKGESFLLQSFYDVHLWDADAVFIYTWQGTNNKLEKKLKLELKKGARVVSHCFIFPNWKPAKIDKRHKLFLYVK